MERVPKGDGTHQTLSVDDPESMSGSWGYRLLVVDDPDDNQLFFNYPHETTSGKVAGEEA